MPLGPFLAGSAAAARRWSRSSRATRRWRRKDGPSEATASESSALVDGGAGAGQANAEDANADVQVDAGVTGDASSTDAGPLSFASDVYPILTARCIACHTPGGSGVVMGNPMPNPMQAPPLAADQVRTIGTWIDQGAAP